jgi:putative copper export protein/methionine-rich copper-binding protein CopC
MRHRRLWVLLRDTRARGCALMLVLLCALPARALAHIRLESSLPAAGATVDVPPTTLRLRFSAHIEARYTTLVAVTADGRRIPLEGFVFEPNSDRELNVPFPAVPPGAVTIEWRTAGADGHVLEGSFAFTIRAAPADTADPVTATPPEHQHDAHAHAAPAHDAAGPLDVTARALQFAALLLLLGALTFRVVIMPRLAVDATMHAQLQRRAWRRITFAAILLVLASVMRLWLQSTALHGSERAFNSELLSIMLTDTSWGRAWLLQALLFALLAAAIAWARPPRDAAARITAIVAAIGLAAIPSLTGHAAGAESGVALAVVNDTLHVLTAGAWIGTLAVLIVDALPALAGDVAGATAAVNTINIFSPLALIAAAIVALTGAGNAWMHFDRVDQLWTTDYGLVLMLKLAFVFLVVSAGAYNWRVVRPRLAAAPDVARLRRSAAAEVLFAAAVLLATAVLTGLPRP